MGNRQISVFLILLSASLAVIWAHGVGRSVPGGLLGFQGVYYGARCLIDHCDPYNAGQLDQFYRREAGEHLAERPEQRQAITLYVNLPTTFLFVAPFAFLPWASAHTLWLALIVVCMCTASVLIWRLCEKGAPGVSTLLICVLLMNSVVVFAGGNTAGIVVGLCIIATYSFLKNRFVAGGILLFAICLVIKPHDVGLIWLYFLLAGKPFQKPAFASFGLALVLGLAAFLWVSHSAPHWLPEIRANLTAISGHGGINDPGPASLTGRTAEMVIDLQALLSIFWDEPHFYNLCSYAVCAVFLAIWSLKILRSAVPSERAMVALAAAVPITLLATYHRPYDSKLLLLTIPACSALWASRKVVGHLALFFTTASILFTGDIPLAILIEMAKRIQIHQDGLTGKVLAALLIRPASLTLLALAFFFLWVLVGKDPEDESSRTGTVTP